MPRPTSPRTPKSPATTRSPGTTKSPRTTKSSSRAYDLEVCILSGLITESFARANPAVCRTLRLRGDQTLEQLHRAIFDAFDRFDEHLYEFQVGGLRPMDPRARRYVPPVEDEFDTGGPRPAGHVDTTTLDALGLKQDEAFGYWFDFGDDWWHQVTVVAIHDPPPAGPYPKLIAKVGASPPQYPDLEDD